MIEPTKRLDRARVDWPTIDPRQTFSEVEAEYGITKEIDDRKPWDLGHQPSRSYYRRREPNFDLMRRLFDFVTFVAK